MAERLDTDGPPNAAQRRRASMPLIVVLSTLLALGAWATIVLGPESPRVPSRSIAPAAWGPLEPSVSMRGGALTSTAPVRTLALVNLPELQFVDGSGAVVSSVVIFDRHGKKLGESDARGRWEVAQEAELVAAAHPDYEPRPVDLRSIVRDETVTLREASRIEGLVVDQDERPLPHVRVIASRLGVDHDPGARVMVVRPSEDATDVCYSSTGRTDAAGRFSFRGLLPGDHEIVAAQPGYVCIGSADVGIEGVAVRASRDPPAVVLRLHRCYVATLRLITNGFPAPYVDSCFGVSHGHPRGLLPLNRAQADLGDLDAWLRSRGAEEGTRITALAYASTKSNLDGGVQIPATMSVLGRRVARSALTFAPIDQWTPKEITTVQVAVPPPDQVIVEADCDVVLRADDGVPRVFLPVAIERGFHTFLAPPGRYRIQPRSDGMIGWHFATVVIDVPSEAPIHHFSWTQPTLTITVVDRGGRPSTRGSVFLKGPKSEMFTQAAHLTRMGSIPILPGVYEARLSLAGQRAIDTQQIVVAAGSGRSEILLRWH